MGKARARIEKSRWDHARQVEKEAEDEKLERRRAVHTEGLRQAKVEAMHRASAKREIARLNAVREKRINEITEARMRKFRESQYLAQAKASLQPQFAEKKEDEDDEGEPGEHMEVTLSRAEKKEQEEFQKTFEMQQRAERRAARAEKAKKEEAKRSKLEALGAKDPAAYEIQRIHQWFREDKEKKERLEQAKLESELKVEVAQKKKLQQDHQRVTTFERLEKVRRERSREREERRNEGVRARIKDLSIGTALPMCLSY